MFDPDNSITIIPEDIYESNLFLHLIVLVYAACGRYWTWELAWAICQCTLNTLGLYCSCVVLHFTVYKFKLRTQILNFGIWTLFIQGCDSYLYCCMCEHIVLHFFINCIVLPKRSWFHCIRYLILYQHRIKMVCLFW